jgi:hypothetical protein
VEVLVKLVEHVESLLEKTGNDEGLAEVESALVTDRPVESLVQELEKEESRMVQAPSIELVQMAWPSPTATARGAVVATVGVFALLAAATVASAVYLPNATFGLWSDYFGLFLASVAASSVTGAVTALGLWSLRKPLA